MKCLKEYQIASTIEKCLGDPSSDTSLLSFKRIMKLDKEEQYPEECCQILDNLGLNTYYIPQRYGGDLTNIDELAMLLRIISRRDLTLSIAHGGKLLSLMPIWLSENETIKKKISNLVATNRKLSLALTEYNHGSDLLQGEFSAIENESGFLLNGQKWLISHARTSSASTILAKTNPNGGLRGFSLFYIDKSKVPRSCISYLPKIRTMGTRGLEMGGFQILDLQLKREDMISEKGKGIDIVLKGLQFTRNLCSAFSIGALDTTLRTVYSFLGERRLYKNNILNAPVIQQTLCDAFLSLIACDCLSRAVNRCFHLLPDHCSLYSAIIKGIIPEFLEEQINVVSKLAGARFFLTDEYQNGILQKMLRDNLVIGLGDGNTAVNLHSVLIQMHTVFKHQSSGSHSYSGLLTKIYDAEIPLPELDFSAFALTSQGNDSMLAGLGYAKDYFDNRDTEIERIVAQQIDNFIAELERLKVVLMSEHRNLMNVYEIPAQMFTLSRKYCFIHMASACLNTFIQNHKKKLFFNSGPQWLCMCLNLLLNRIGSTPIPFANEKTAREEIIGILANLCTENQLFSLFPFKLGEICQEN